jgi:CDP-glucose 4,6-dehydratase
MEIMEMNQDKLFSGIFRNKRVLITGDTGFKGSWLALWLKELGAEVFGYALPPVSPSDNFVRCKLDGVIHHRDGDVRNPEYLLGYFREVQPDIAFHLAAQAIVLKSYEEPQPTFDTNIMGAVNFFEAVRKTPSVKVALNITSDKCYQNREQIWGYREDDPMGGHDPYSASKGCSELITHSYQASFFLEAGTCSVASARAGNVIGGGDWAPYRIVPDFFRSVLSNEPLVIRNPEARRPWQHVFEPLSGYLLLASLLWKNGKDYSGGWNFGPVETNWSTVKELIEAIIRVTGKGSFVTPEMKNAPHEAHLLKLDISKAAERMNWAPVLNFEQTVFFTATGYMDEIRETGNLSQKRLEQILQYTGIATENSVIWTK